MNKYHLRIQMADQTKTLHVPADAPGTLTDLLRHAGLPLNTRCGQRGVCEGCVVELVSGTLAHAVNHKTLRAGGTPQEVRACAFRPASDLHLTIPQRALLSYAPQVLDGYAIRITHARDPLVAARWGVAVDVGTTTVALLLIDLETCAVAARASAFNAQMNLGDDVITRITLCMGAPTMLLQLQAAILEQTIAPLLAEALAAVGAAVADVGAMVIAGNTTMLHLLAGEDPAPLGVVPFTPRFTQHRVLPAGQLVPAWRESLGHMPVHLLPSATAYIGADIVAGLVATGMAYEPETALLVDVGTNGEIVLRHRDHLLGCATAAGPAFEGARLLSGMRAGDGAITDIVLAPATGQHQLKWIGQDRGAAPAGLCGSAYIDFLAEARRTGLLSVHGRLDRGVGPESSWDTSATLATYRLAQGQGKRPIQVNECDIASLLSAKAAIGAGIQILLGQAGVAPAEVKHLFLAGGFGTHMDVRNAVAIGMLPGFVPEQIVPVGNSSLAGAFLALTDKSLLADLQRTAERVEALELNLVPSFQDTYIDALALP